MRPAWGQDANASRVPSLTGVDLANRAGEMSRRARTRVLAWAVDVEVDPMVGGVVRFVDSGFWRGAD